MPRRSAKNNPQTMAKAPTLQSIADRLELSRSTVSLALRNSPLVNTKTREEVWRVARELKYKPNPMISALMTSLRRSFPGNTQPTIAYLSAYNRRDGWDFSYSFRKFHSGAKARCEEYGFSLESFWLKEPGMSGARMADILRARGIRGVLMAPLPKVDMELDFPWQHFALASLGYSLRNPALHRAVSNQYLSTETALKSLHRMGYRRIGLALYQVEEDRGAHNYRAAYLIYQQNIPAANRLTAYIPEKLEREGFVRWCRQQKPDVILTFELLISEWVKDLNLRMPEDVALASLHAHEENHAGIDQQPEIVGAAAVDLIISQINRNETGIPQYAKTVMIEGVWKDGSNVPLRTARAAGNVKKIARATTSHSKRQP